METASDSEDWRPETLADDDEHADEDFAQDSNESAAFSSGIDGPSTAAAAAAALPMPAEGAAAAANATSSSIYHGVAWYKNRGWRAHVWHMNKKVYLGVFATEGEAARSVDAACRERGLPVINEATAGGDRDPLETAPGASKPHSSIYNGCNWDATAAMWKSSIWCGGRQLHIGRYNTEAAAAQAVDEAWVERGLPPRNAELLAQTLPSSHGASSPGAPPSRVRRRTPSSIFSGCSWDKSRNKWKVAIVHEGQHRYIGDFDDEWAAGKAADDARAALGVPRRNESLLAEAAAASGAQHVIPQNFGAAAAAAAAAAAPLPVMAAAAAVAVQVPGSQAAASPALPRGRSTSRFKYVGQHKGKWRAQARINGKKLHFGHFSTEEDAARAVDAAFVERGLPGPNAAVLSGAIAGIDKRASSIYSGVTWSKNANKWLAYIDRDGKRLHLGTHICEAEAGKAVDDGWASLGLPRRNADLLAQHDSAECAQRGGDETEDETEDEAGNLGAAAAAAAALPAARARTKSGSTSRFKYVAQHKGKWRAQARINGEKRYLGRFSAEEMAARAVDAAFVERGLPGPNAAVLSGAIARIDRSTSSIYSGVTWRKDKKKWRAYIDRDGKRLNFGTHICEAEAAQAVDDGWASLGLPRKNAALLAQHDSADYALRSPAMPIPGKPNQFVYDGKTYTGLALKNKGWLKVECHEAGGKSNFRFAALGLGAEWREASEIPVVGHSVGLTEDEAEDAAAARSRPRRSRGISAAGAAAAESSCTMALFDEDSLYSGYEETEYTWDSDDGSRKRSRTDASAQGGGGSGKRRRQAAEEVSGAPDQFVLRGKTYTGMSFSHKAGWFKAMCHETGAEENMRFPSLGLSKEWRARSGIPGAGAGELAGTELTVDVADLGDGDDDQPGPARLRLDTSGWTE